jgi:hypothetical protein
LVCLQPVPTVPITTTLYQSTSTFHILLDKHFIPKE